MPPERPVDSQISPPVTAYGIVFGRETIRELGPLASHARVPVNQVRAFEFKYATLSNHPGLQIIVGAGLLSPIYLVIRALLDPLTTGARICVTMQSIALAACFLGLWLIFDALRKQHHLIVITNSNRYKLRLLHAMDESSMLAVRDAAARGSGLIMS